MWAVCTVKDGENAFITIAQLFFLVNEQLCIALQFDFGCCLMFSLVYIESGLHAIKHVTFPPCLSFLQM